MDNMEKAKRDYSLSMLKKVIEHKELERMILGYQGYCLEYTDEVGIRFPDTRYIINAVYDYYQENPNSRIDKEVYDILLNAAKNYKSISSIRSVISYVANQINAEQFNKAPFKMDNITLLKEIKNNLVVNSSLYKKEFIDEMQNMFNIIEKSSSSK